MLASWFVYDGVQAALHPEEHLESARQGVALVGSVVDDVPDLDDKKLALVVRAHGVATAVAGLSFALSKAPRSSALTLVALTLPLAVVDQPFTGSKAERRERTPKFVRRVGAVGAALLATGDLEGRPGVAWRVDKARKDLELSKRVHDAGSSLEDAASGAARKSRHAAKDAARAIKLEAHEAKDSARRAARTARKALPDVH
ncbi:hypothetical protein GCM10025865_22230 [Paraoerskovia sediminicola]|uniref:DoxX protein n=2 Tax=Paraoerskovia sediminicola TaxID=1138587 RepID=A0ABM8G4E6_9CELL|nr:hypothetical protein GCM10025865_22230 [Paraoerskovia sediminicola]